MISQQCLASYAPTINKNNKKKRKVRCYIDKLVVSGSHLEDMVTIFSCGHDSFGMPMMFKHCPKCGAKVMGFNDNFLTVDYTKEC